MNPPSNTDNWASAAFSGNESRSHDQSNTARSVACRSTRPPVDESSLNRSLMRERSVRGGITRTRAAASSIASGRPSSSFTSAANRRLILGARLNPGFAASALRRNSAAASAGASGAKAILLRLAAPALRAWSPGTGPRSRDSASGPKFPRVARHLLEIVEDHQALPRPAIACPSWITGSSLPSGMSSPCATACTMPSRLRAWPDRRTRRRQGTLRASPTRTA